MSDGMEAQGAAAPASDSEFVSGGCLCGQVRYRARTARARAMVCHCRDCQKQSGSAFSVLFGLPAKDFLLEGVLNTFVGTADSGRTVHRRFCPDCGSPVLTELPAQPGMVIVKGGTLDDPSWLAPGLHLWHKSAQPWVASTMPADLNSLPEQPK